MCTRQNARAHAAFFIPFFFVLLISFPFISWWLWLLLAYSSRFVCMCVRLCICTLYKYCATRDCLPLNTCNTERKTFFWFCVAGRSEIWILVWAQRVVLLCEHKVICWNKVATRNFLHWKKPRDDHEHIHRHGYRP